MINVKRAKTAGLNTAAFTILFLCFIGVLTSGCNRKKEADVTLNAELHRYFEEDIHFPYIIQSLEKSWTFYVFADNDKISQSRADLISTIEKRRVEKIKDPQNIKPLCADLNENSLSLLLHWMLSAYKDEPALKGIQSLELFDAKGILLGYSVRDSNLMVDSHPATHKEKFFAYYLDDNDLKELQDHFQKEDISKRSFLYRSDKPKELLMIISASTHAKKETILGYMRVKF